MSFDWIQEVQQMDVISIELMLDESNKLLDP